MEWNYNLNEAPIDTPIQLLSRDDSPMFPQQVFVGTLEYGHTNELIRGKCLVGDPDYFYRSAMVAWKECGSLKRHSPKEVYEWLGRVHLNVQDCDKQFWEYMRDLKTYIGAFEQIEWERDVAIQQLHDLGYELGQITKKKSQI